MIKDLYNTNILRLSSDIPRLGKLDNPDSSSTVVSKLCGSKITVYLNMEDNIVNYFIFLSTEKWSYPQEND